MKFIALNFFHEGKYDLDVHSHNNIQRSVIIHILTTK